ncbi:hypothetical protein [Actinomyces wuliandei]|uniref:hypothetical protein n=1 Tax=Actinomyces wuliandei TaxID=2057743 RepID=UPI001117B1AA|nr:hypothetical protein [Actinomyces wuliandei]
MTDAASTGTGTIDTEIPGSTGSVNDAADWLYDLKEDLHDARTFSTNCATMAGADFSGETAEAVVAFSNKLKNACDDAYNRAKKAADVVRAFADQLGWCQADMAGHRETASNGGLTVDGYLVRAPASVEPPGDLPKGATKEDKEKWLAADEAYDDYQDKLALYEEVREDVERTRTSLEDWIEENLVLAEAEALYNMAVDEVRSMLTDMAADSTATVVDNTYQARADVLREAAYQRAVAKGPGAARSLHSTSGRRPPSQAEVNRVIEDSRLLSRWTSKAQALEQTGRRVARSITVITTLGSIGTELARGESPSTVLLTTAAGAGVAAVAAPVVAGMVAGTVLAGSTVVSALAVAAGTAAVAGVVAAGVGYVYESHVPLHVRERINKGLEETGSMVTDAAKDTWDSVTDTASDAADWVTDRWRTTFG